MTLVACPSSLPVAAENIPNLRCSDLVAVATTGERFDACTLRGAHWRDAGVVDDDIVRKAVIASASHDIPCDESRTTIALLPHRSDAVGSFSVASTYFDGSRDIFVDGCKQRITYVESCDEDRASDAWGIRHFRCDYVASARIAQP